MALQSHFLDYHRKVGIEANPLNKIDYLEAENELFRLSAYQLMQPACSASATPAKAR